MKDRTVCFTGHRIIPDAELDFIKKKLASEIEQLIGQGYCSFCAGGALGFDTLAAQAVLEAKEQFLQVKLILALYGVSGLGSANASQAVPFIKALPLSPSQAVPPFFTPSHPRSGKNTVWPGSLSPSKLPGLFLMQ